MKEVLASRFSKAESYQAWTAEGREVDAESLIWGTSVEVDQHRSSSVCKFQLFLIWPFTHTAAVQRRDGRYIFVQTAVGNSNHCIYLGKTWELLTMAILSRKSSEMSEKGDQGAGQSSLPSCKE
jgi:hypothetical protein